MRQKTAYANRFAEYLEKRAEAERSGALEDAVAAGKAWAKFLTLFARTPSRTSIRKQQESTENARPGP
jgi:hypothetical protein